MGGPVNALTAFIVLMVAATITLVVLVLILAQGPRYEIPPAHEWPTPQPVPERTHSSGGQTAARGREAGQCEPLAQPPQPAPEAERARYLREAYAARRARLVSIDDILTDIESGK